MLLKGRSEEVAQRVIEAFQTGNIAAPLATVYLTRTDSKPMGQWSTLNQFVCVLLGCTDARGFDQWKEAGRHVKKGERARAAILVPIRPYKRKAERTDDDSPTSGPILGFTTCPVFDVDQTEGDPLPADPHRPFLDALPLAHVAKAWNIRTETYSGQGNKYQGAYSPNANAILLGVENISTWLHELTHAADHRLGNLTETGQNWRSEIVAELGACVLAHMIGLPGQADEGGAYRYITSYAQKAGIEPITACGRVLDRMTQAIDLILTAAEALTPVV